MIFQDKSARRAFDGHGVRFCLSQGVWQPQPMVHAPNVCIVLRRAGYWAWKSACSVV